MQFLYIAGNNSNQRVGSHTLKLESILKLLKMRDSQNILQLIGDKIIDIKMFSESQGENDWLDYVLTFITLEKNGVINFPFSGAINFGNVEIDQRAKPISDKGNALVVGQTIKELYYESDEENQPRNDWFAYIELNNGYVIHENRMAPNGTGAANLFMYTQEQFLEMRNDGENNLIPLNKIMTLYIEYYGSPRCTD